MAKLKVLGLDTKAIRDCNVSDSIFAIEPRIDIIHRVINWQLAKRRAGTHKTKGISDISGTTRKPWRQKGTGRARQGSLRSPQFRGGATIFGPVVRSHAFKLPKKIRALGLKSALSAKLKSGNLFILDNLELSTPKTKDVTSILKGLGVSNALFIGGQNLNENFSRAASNIPNIDVLPQQGLNVYDIIRREKLFLTEEALQHIEKRLSK